MGGWVDAPGPKTQNYVGCLPEEEVATSSFLILTISRGCLEAGLESLLKAAGGNLLILRISHCPNILTDRSLWLASCYCRALQAVTYRWVYPTRWKAHTLLASGPRDPWTLHVLPQWLSGKGTQGLCGPRKGSGGHQGRWP